MTGRNGLSPAAILAAFLSACGASISCPFVVNVTLDQAAMTELSNSGEEVEVIAYYYWSPVSGGPSHEEDELGYVLGGYSIGEETHEIAREGAARFVGRTRPSSHVQAGHGEARVLINVVSARHTHPNNILDCSVFDESLAKASNQGVNLNCSLIRQSDDDLVGSWRAGRSP